MSVPLSLGVLAAGNTAAPMTVVVFAPGTGKETGIERIAAAGGQAVGFGAWSNVILVRNPPAPDAREKLHNIEAWMVFSSSILAYCLTSDTNPRGQS